MSNINIPIPKNQAELTVDWFNRIFSNQDFKVSKVKFNGDAKIEGRGALSELEKVELEISNADKVNKLHLVLKTLPKNKDIRDYVVNAGFITREIQMFNKVFPAQKQFLQERNLDIKKFQFRHPICYFVGEEGEKKSYTMILVLEDMSASGYEQWTPGPSEHLEMDRLKATLSELARFHGVSISYGIANQIQDYQKELYPFLMDYGQEDKSLQTTAYIDAGFKTVIDLLKQDKSAPEGIISQLEYLSKELYSILRDTFVKTYKFPCITHHDLHTGNFFYSKMMGSDSGSKYQACLIDFQNCMNGNPMDDICFLLFCCSDIKTSWHNLDQVLKFYHTSLMGIINEIGIDFTYPYETMKEDYIKSIRITLLHLITGAPIWCYGPESNQISRDRLLGGLKLAYEMGLLNYSRKSLELE